MLSRNAALELTTEARARLQQYPDEHPRGRERRLVYNPKRYSGVEREESSKRFNFYFEQFPAQQETKQFPAFLKFARLP